MDKEDIVNRLLIVIIIALVVVVIFSVIDRRKQEENYKQLISTSDKTIENTIYMELDIGDEKGSEPRPSPAVFISDESKLNVLEDMINAGEKYEFKNPVGFDTLPTAYLYKEDGEVITIAAIDNYDDVEDKGNFVIYTTSKSETKRVYKVNDRVGKFITDLYKDRTDNKIMLYDGYELYGTTGIQVLSDMPKDEVNEERFEVKYYNYSKNRELKSSTGKFEEETYEGYAIVDGVEKFAVTKDYELLPRQSKKLKNLPEKLNDLEEKYTNVEIEEIDLDGDYKLEYILSAKKIIDEDDNREIKSKIQLLDSELNIVATLASWNASKEGGNPNDLTLDLNDVMYFDLNDDDKMEILVEFPGYETSYVGIYRFIDGILYGENNYKVTLAP